MDQALLSRIIGILLLIPLVASAQSANAGSKQDKERVAEESSRTLYPFSSLTLRDTLTTSRWNAGDTANLSELRSLTPLRLWTKPTLLRVVIPYRTKSQIGVGLGDVRAFDLVVLKRPWGFWGIGPAVNLRSRSAMVTDTIQAGAVTGIVVAARHWGFGLLNQNIFSGQVAVTTLQPILAYQVNPTWSLGIGELPFVYDWNHGRFLLAPIGVQLGAVVNVSGQLIRSFLNPQFNAKNLPGVSRWSVTFGISFLAPYRD